MYMKNVMMRGVGHSAGEERQGPSCRAGGGLPTQEQMREEAEKRQAAEEQKQSVLAAVMDPQAKARRRAWIRPVH